MPVFTFTGRFLFCAGTTKFLLTQYYGKALHFVLEQLNSMRTQASIWGSAGSRKQ